MPTYRNGQLGELLESLLWVPGVQGGTDLEASTKTISNTSESATPDYTSSHNIPAPADARIAVLRGCMRLTVTIDSWGGGGVQLNYRVKRGGVSVSTGVLAVAAATGQKIISWDITTLITGAQTNTIFLWVDAGTCVISEVTTWTGVGSSQTNRTNPAVSITHAGWLQIAGMRVTRVGTGNIELLITLAATLATTLNSVGYATAGTILNTGGSAHLNQPYLTPAILYLFIGGLTVATDIGYFETCNLSLRSQP